jgi:hypothetical protein
MKNIEIPYATDRGKWYRFWEIVPGFLSWTILLLPFVLSIINPTLFAVFIIAYLLMWFFKGIAMSIRSVQGYKMLTKQQSLNWQLLIDDLEAGEIIHPHGKNPTWHQRNVARLVEYPLFCKPSEVYHALIIATYNESRETLEPTIQSVLASKYDMKKVILVLAFEERGGERVEKQATELMATYASQFRHAFAVKHPKDLPNEVVGKGGNITYAGRELQKYLS